MRSRVTVSRQAETILPGGDDCWKMPVGAHLLNHLRDFPYSVYYWRHRGVEMDFVVQTPRKIWALEVKSGKLKSAKGVSGFKKYCPEANISIIGPEGISFDEFFRTHPKDLFA